MEETQYFSHKKMVPEKLLAYGFTHTGGAYHLSKAVLDGQFQLLVTVSGASLVDTTMIDNATGEEYVLHRVREASGAFVGSVKAAYEAVLLEIAESCFVADVFKSDQAKALIAYVRETHGDELEFLWKKFDNNAIWRRKDTKKWYAALLTVSRRKMGLSSDEVVEILDLRIDPKEIDSVVDHARYFPGWHMNKRSWITVILDGSVPLAEIEAKLDESYRLATR